MDARLDIHARVAFWSGHWGLSRATESHKRHHQIKQTTTAWKLNLLNELLPIKSTTNFKGYKGVLRIVQLYSSNSLQLSPEVEANSGDLYRNAKRRGRYLALFTDPEGDRISIYQISWIKMEKSNFL